jgi:methylated-DNA-[protein]-cysteine S-methyltransferase
MSILIRTSPLGPLTLVSCEGQLVGCYFATSDFSRRQRAGHAEDSDANDIVLRAARFELEAYFAHRLTQFTIPVAPPGTEFQRSVWQALLDIPFGKTVSYAFIAKQVGKPTALRAIGAAIGKNPLSIVIPCHRVIGAHGALTGFAGGLSRKRYLLAHEQVNLIDRIDSGSIKPTARLMT